MFPWKPTLGTGLAATVVAVAGAFVAAAASGYDFFHSLEVLGPWMTLGLVVARQFSMHGENRRALVDLLQEVRDLRKDFNRHINQHLEGRL